VIAFDPRTFEMTSPARFLVPSGVSYARMAAVLGILTLCVVGGAVWLARRRNPFGDADHKLLGLEKWRLRLGESSTLEKFLNSFKAELQFGTLLMADVINAYGRAQVRGADPRIVTRSLAGQARAYEALAAALLESIPHVTAAADQFSTDGTADDVHRMLGKQARDYENKALAKSVLIARGARANGRTADADAVRARLRLREVDAARLTAIIAGENKPDLPIEPYTPREFDQSE
jgi:hypothetical protein